MDPAATLSAGAPLGPWRVASVLGQGATGTVYAALRDDGARAAVKVLRAGAADDPVAHVRFLREVSLVRNVVHPALVRVIDAGSLDDGRPWFAMPLLRGETLAASLARDGARAPADAWATLRPVAEALAALHAAGVVHRDVKPDNVFLAQGEDGRVQPTLLDLGLARPEAVPHGAAGPRTATGSMTGTPAYMPPEQWWGEGVGPASDQYALGVTAWELLTGARPFPQRALDALMRAHLDDPPPATALPSPVAAWLARCLAKSPAGRFPSMEALIEAGDEAFGARPRKARRAPWLGAAAVATSLVAAGYQGEHSPREWMRLGGWAAWPTVAFALTGAVAFARRPERVHGFAAAALLAGAAGTWSGFGAIERGLPRAPATAQFEIFHLGVSEANANRYLAAGVALALGAATLLAGRATSPRDASLHRATAWGSVAMAALAVGLGAPSAAFPCLALALVGAARPDDVARAAQGLVLVALGAAVGVTRVESRASVAWDEAPDRASRVRELLAAQGEQRAVLALGAVALAVAAAGLWRARGRRGVPRGRAALACVALWGALEAGHEARVALRRRSLYAALAPQFALFARLDPPAGEGLPAPSAAPSLRVARDVIAVDDQRVGLHAALDAPVGTNALALDLSHRLAREGPAEGRAQLSLMADARAPGAVVGRALAVAWGVGVRRAEVLFTRGRSPGALPPGAPEEAAWVLPRDFVALPVALGADGTAVDDAPFGEQAARWARAGGRVTLAVGR
ncbi:MAG: serine/threonine-protein kinase [Polyangiales bacterium]